MRPSCQSQSSLIFSVSRTNPSIMNYNKQGTRDQSHEKLMTDYQSLKYADYRDSNITTKAPFATVL